MEVQDVSKEKFPVQREEAFSPQEFNKFLSVRMNHFKLNSLSKLLLKQERAINFKFFPKIRKKTNLQHKRNA